MVSIIFMVFLNFFFRCMHILGLWRYDLFSLDLGKKIMPLYVFILNLR
jgi:hypothetical protein